MSQTAQSLLAIDVGNSRIKLGRFDDGILKRHVSLALAAGDRPDPRSLDHLVAVLMAGPRPGVVLASVNESSGAAEAILGRVREEARSPVVRVADPRAVPLTVDVAEPLRVGMDRLLDALAADRLRPVDRPAVVVDCGSATTVDLVSADGVFRGGSILAGLGMSLRALHEFTAKLPAVDLDALHRPPRAGPAPALPTIPGRTTREAIASGVYWGMVGAVRELVQRTGRGVGGDPFLVITGGDGPCLADGLGLPCVVAPALGLWGLYLAARHGGLVAGLPPPRFREAGDDLGLPKTLPDQHG